MLHLGESSLDARPRHRWLCAGAANAAARGLRGGPRMSADLSTGRALTRQHRVGRNSTSCVRIAWSEGSSGTR
jgi:hypothetical protein